VWPRDFLLPIIDGEIKQLLRYLTRDSSWKDCFGVQVEADGMVARLKRGSLWRGILRGHPEISDDYLANLVAEVALSKGLAVLHKGTQMVIVKKGTDPEAKDN
jgi:predicted RNA-binding protein with PUA domain